MSKPSAARAAVPAPAVKSDEHSRPTVSVACKIPNGLVLQLFEMIEDYEPVMGGGSRKIKKAKPIDGATFTVRGPASPNGQAPRGYLRPAVAGGYAITPNVPADLWDKWLEQNRSAPYVRNGMIFATDRRDETIKEAKGNRDVMSGLEPVNPAGDKRIAKPRVQGVDMVTTAPELVRDGPELSEVAYPDTE